MKEKRSVVTRVGAGFLAAVLLLCLARAFVQARFDAYLVESTEMNYEAGLEQLAYKLDSTLDDIHQQLRRIAEDRSVCALTPNEPSYEQQQRLNDVIALLRVSVGNNESVDALYLYIPGRTLSSLLLIPSNNFAQFAPLDCAPLMTLLSDGAAFVDMRNPAFSAPNAIRDDNVFCRAFELDNGEHALVLARLRENWLAQLFAGAPVRVFAPDTRVLFDSIPTSAHDVLRAACTGGWTLEWDARVTTVVSRNKWANLAFAGSLVLVLALMLLFSRRMARATPVAYLTLAVALPVMFYVVTHFALMYDAVSQTVYSSCRMAYDNVLANVETVLTRAENTILRVMFDPDVYDADKLEDSDLRLHSIHSHLSAANTGMFFRAFDDAGNLLFQTHSFGFSTPDHVDFQPKMINTLLRGKPTLENELGGQRYLVYTVKVYDIGDMNQTSFLQVGLPEAELSRVFSGGTGFVTDLFVMGQDGTILSCANARRIGQTAQMNGTDFVNVIGKTSLRLVAVPDVAKITNDLFTLSVSSVLYVLVALLVFLLCVHILLASRLSTEAIRRAELETIRRTLEIQTLQAQISPHFLCNTIETIRCLSDEDCSETASYMLSQLSDMFKFGISRMDNAISVGEELSYARAYIRLMNLRFDERILDVWHIDERLVHESTLKLILQPILENSIRHTFDQVERLTLSITLEAEGNDKMRFVITDDGVGIPPETLTRIRAEMERGEIRDHVGLVNVARRIRLFYGDPYGLEIDSKPDCDTTVRIVLPRG